MSLRSISVLAALSLSSCLVARPSLFAQDNGKPTQSENSAWESDFSQMSIAELVNVKVTTASRKPEKLSDVASAVYVLSGEDIRRSGVTNVPDALRLVPGVNVSQIDRSQWGVSIRGFNGVFSDKLLVLIDGRTVYTPLFAGVFWNEQDLPLEDIERIEVIRGPGATLWGANAVNGVINILTKSAEKTHGILASVGAGKEQNVLGTLRYGDKVSDTDYRAYFKASVQDGNRLESGSTAHDDWNSYRAGFRTDTKITDKDNFTFQGDNYYGESGWDAVLPSLQNIANNEDVTRYYNGQNILGKWSRNISDTSNLTIQTYWDRVERNDVVLQEKRNTFDIDGQFRFSPLSGNDVLVGAGYRVYRDEHDGTFAVSVTPEADTLDLYTAFIQDEITLVPSQLKFVVGTKFEASQFAGAQFMPNARLTFTPNESNTIWGSVSRALRTPARFNKDGRIVGAVLPSQPVVTAVSINGNREYDSEKLIAYELGYRTQLIDKVSLDIATFYNHYDELESLEPSGEPFLSFLDGTPFIEAPFNVQNKLKGNVYGGELALDVRPFEWWRLVGSYSHFNIQLDRDSDSQDTVYSAGERQTSRNQVSVRSQINLPKNMEFDTTLRYVSNVQSFDIGSYVAVDARLGWHASQNLELSLVGKNLLDSAHIEYTSNLVATSRTEIERAVFGKLTYRF